MDPCNETRGLTDPAPAQLPRSVPDAEAPVPAGKSHHRRRGPALPDEQTSREPFLRRLYTTIQSASAFRGIQPFAGSRERDGLYEGRFIRGIRAIRAACAYQEDSRSDARNRESGFQGHPQHPCPLIVGRGFAWGRFFLWDVADPSGISSGANRNLRRAFGPASHTPPGSGARGWRYG